MFAKSLYSDREELIFEPEPDITAFELALVFKQMELTPIGRDAVLVRQPDGSYRGEVVRSLTEIDSRIERHFRRVSRVPAYERKL